MSARLQRIPPLDAAERFFLDLLPASETQAPPDTTPQFWQRVLSLALNHRLAGYLFTRHRDFAWWQECPDPFRQTLRQHHVQTALRNEMFQKELAVILQALAQDGIEPVLLKGSALNLVVYQDPGERFHADIDLLVSPDQLDKTCAIMRGCGYEIDDKTHPENFYRRHHFHLIFRHSRRAWCCIEIHWDLTLPAMDTAFRADELRERAVPYHPATPHQWTRQSVLTPAPDDFLLHLCLHSGSNGFSILAQIRDIHAVLGHQAWQGDPSDFWRKAQRYRIVTPAAGCLELARLFGESNRLAELQRAAPHRGLRGNLGALLRPETILRQRLLASAAGGRAISLQRRDGTKDQLAYLGRILRPSAVDAGLDGRSVPDLDQAEARHFSWHGLSLALRMGIYLLLARSGWEIAPALIGRRTRSLPEV